jgi:hypothetical protein
MNKAQTPKNTGHPELYQYQSSFLFPVPERHNEWEKMSLNNSKIV